MKKIIGAIVLCFLICYDLQSGSNSLIHKTNVCTYCIEFNELNFEICSNQISQEDALKKTQLLIPKIKEYYYQNGGGNYPDSTWYFPVQHYNKKMIGGVKGNGYIASKYNYFHGNKHSGHPAQDIFIFDKNHDSKDDNTNKPVNVLSTTGGIVIAVDTTWQPTSKLRGGNFIYIFDPYSNNFFYYAHNDKIFVHLGNFVKPGDSIATVGRTGLNAYKKRSPTHLHFMQLKLDENYYPMPVNCYKILIKAKS